MPEPRTIHGIRILEYPAEGPILSNDRAIMDLIADGRSNSADMVVVPTTRFSPEFFQLRTRLAGDLLQKFVNYQLRLTILGDLTNEASESQSLQAFIRESNRGAHLWFLPTLDDLEEKLAATGKTPAEPLRRRCDGSAGESPLSLPASQLL
jgi:hypothetical protein